MRYATYLVSTVLIAFVSGRDTHAQTSPSSTIRVEHAWARATPAGAKTGVTYLIIGNEGRSADRLLSATTPRAQNMQFHEETNENGISRMRQLRAVEVNPGAKVTFKPGGMHMMMIGLKQPLKEGENFPLSLNLEKAGKIDVTVSVAKLGAMQEGDMGSMSHGGDGPTKK